MAVASRIASLTCRGFHWNEASILSRFLAAGTDATRSSALARRYRDVTRSWRLATPSRTAHFAGVCSGRSKLVPDRFDVWLVDQTSGFVSLAVQFSKLGRNVVGRTDEELLDQSGRPQPVAGTEGC